MPEMLDPSKTPTNFVAIPSQARPVAPRQPQQPAAPPSAFRAEPGPTVLILPHADAGGPERQQRGGRPVRMSMEHIPALWEGVKANPHDDAPWLVLADALDEAGKPATAAHMRDMGSRGERRLSHGSHGRQYRYLDTVPTGQSVSLGGFIPRFGTVAGVPVRVIHYSGESSVGHGVEGGHGLVAGAHWMPQDRAEAIAAEFDPPASHPERFAAQAPAVTGMVVRGIQYKPGQMLPKEATQPVAPPPVQAPAPKASRRDRLRGLIRQRSGGKVRAMRERSPVRMMREDFLRAIKAAPHDDAPKLVYSDWLEENGNARAAAAIRQHVGHVDIGLSGEDVFRGLVDAGLHDGTIDPRRVREDHGRGERIAEWNFYDRHQGPNPFPQTVYLESGEHDPDPNSPHSQPVGVHRWASWQDGSGPLDRGAWTVDRGKAHADGVAYAEDNDMDPVDELGYDPRA